MDITPTDSALLTCGVIIMASKKNDPSKDDKKGYQPKATARHAKMTRTKQEEIAALKQRIDTDKHLAKKYESNRKTEIKALPREDRAAAKEELRESIAKRKEAENRDREKLRALMQEEKQERGGSIEKSPFDEDAWVSGGRKKAKKDDTQAEAKPASEPAPEVVPEVPAEAEPAPEVKADSPSATEAPLPEPAPEQKEASEKKN